MMTVIHYNYPGDPIELQLMFGAEFTATHRNRETVIAFGDGQVTRIPIDDEEIVCDVCNAGIGQTDPLSLEQWGVRCWDCTQQLLMRDGTVNSIEVRR